MQHRRQTGFPGATSRFEAAHRLSQLRPSGRGAVAIRRLGGVLCDRTRRTDSDHPGFSVSETGDRQHADQIPLRGGHLALDFVNTAGWHASDEPSEWLVDYDEVLRWARHVGVLDVRGAAALARRAAARPREAEAARRRLLAFREAAFRTFRAVTAGRAAAASDLAAIAAANADALRRAQLVPASTRYELRWPVDDALDVPLWKPASAVLALLTSGELERLRECGGHPCGWLFLDRSPNRSRRWCSSEECGNRERVRRFTSRR